MTQITTEKLSENIEKVGKTIAPVSCDLGLQTFFVPALASNSIFTHRRPLAFRHSEGATVLHALFR